MKNKIICKYCNKDTIKKNGKTKGGKQRYLCATCKKTSTIKQVLKKRAREHHWFKLWIKEGYTIRQLARQSSHSMAKIKNIIRHHIMQNPPVGGALDSVQGIIVDGTFIYKRICLFVVMNARTHTVIDGRYPLREFCFAEVLLFIQSLKQRGLCPKYAVLDGNPHVIRALKEIYPDICIQRCLTHIQRQCLSWCRQRPTRPDAKELRAIAYQVSYIHTHKEKELWIAQFRNWELKYKRSFAPVDARDRVVGDIIRAASVLRNVLPDMFQYLDDNSIPKSTSCLEGYFSRLKHKYFAHRGLSPKRRTLYFKWFLHYCKR